MRSLLATLLLVCSLSLTAAPPEILWDKHGIPHIFASSIEDMFYAHGWAQTHNHADLLLKLYGQSRGRAAEYWGPENLALDKWVRTNGVPERAADWYKAQSPDFRKNIDAFARGINDYAKAHPNHVSEAYRQVLPVSGIDVVGHTLRAVHYMYMGSMNRMRTEITPLLNRTRAAALQREIPGPVADADAGSNTWTVGPSRSASGKAMLIINPHLQWGDFYTYMEVHLVGPGYDLFGAPQIGFPTPVVGFNPKAGWSRTVNTIDTVDFYQLKVRDGKYEFDGALKDFQRSSVTLKIKQPDGRLTEERLEVRRSIHGPVVFDDQGITVSMRVAGIDRPRMLEQWFRMGGATNLKSFEDALRINSVPMWNANYADDQGHILLVCHGAIPRRPKGDWAFWSGVVPGDTSKTLWTSYLNYDEFPKSLDPKSGFNQNANEPPWLTTEPQLDPAKYPPYLAPPRDRVTSFRTRRSLRMISEDKSITFDELKAYKHNTRVELADAVLPDLLANADAEPDSLVREALTVLKSWDRNFDATSVGAVLFHAWSDRFFGTSDFINEKFRVKYNPDKPLDSSYGISDVPTARRALRDAADHVRSTYGSLTVPYGEVYRFDRGAKDVPGNGGAGRMGLFRTLTFTRQKGNRFYPFHGETIVCAIEFGSPQRAECLLGYGNASQPGSKHIDDQLQYLSSKQLLPVLRSRKDILANLEAKETLKP